MDRNEPHNVGHPSPQRFRVGALRLAAGLFGAPAAWVAQMNVSESVASYACYPHQAPLAEAGAPHVTAVLALIGAACFAAALVAGGVVLYLTAPKHGDVSVQTTAGAGSFGLRVGGSF